MRKPLRILLILAVCAVSAPIAAADVAVPAAAAAKPAAPAAASPATQKAADKGIAWLVAHQLPNGGFGQGEESQQMGRGANLANAANVADTSIAALALIRSGSTPKTGPHKEQVMKAVDYVLREVEASDEKSIFVTQTRGTRVQSKLGQAIDTFMAISLLTELEGKMPDDKSALRVDMALRKALSKVQKNQRSDGSFEQSGWAPVLSQGLAVKGLATASAQGYDVDDKVQAKAETWSKDQVNADKGFTGKSAGAAGIGLYGGSANTMALQSTSEKNERERKTVEKQAKEAATEEARSEAKAKLKRFDETKKAAEDAQKQLAARANDPNFIAGFGNNGGEEFLSYMLMAETLRKSNQTEFAAWHAKMQQNLARVQNGDGSWTGHHCITGRTFVTSSALLVMLADKAPLDIKKLTGGARG